jgi:DHA1 family bicyclomycin/chloramphenicol resistance-like MFS transporter
LIDKKPSNFQLVAMSVLGPFTMHLIIPAITPIQFEFGIDAGMAALLISGTLWGIAGSTLFFGAFADRFGRRIMLLIGMGVFVMGSVIGLYGESAGMVIAGRIIQGVGGATGMVISRAVVRDLYERDKGTSVLAYLTMAVMIAPMIAPAAAGYMVEQMGWRTIFMVAAGLGLVIWFWLIMRFPETIKETIPMPNVMALLKAYASVIKEPIFLLYTLTGTFVMTSFFSMMSGAPHVAENTWSLSRDELGYYLGIGATGMMISTFITARIAERFDNNKLIITGASIVVFGVVTSCTLFALGFNHPLSLFGPMFLNGIGAGFVLPTTTAQALSITPRMAGTASGMMTFLQFIIAGIAAQLIGYFDHSTPWSVLGFMAVAVTLAMIMAISAVSLARRRAAAA